MVMVSNIPLHLACANGHIDAIELLLTHGANIDAIDKNGWSPLHHAADNDHYDACKYLLNMKANVDICSDQGGYAYDRTNTSISKLFIRCGFDLRDYVANCHDYSDMIDTLIDIVEDFAGS